jgi:putative transposase
MHSSSREEIVADFDDLHEVVSRLLGHSFDALTTPECLAMLERLEREARRLPVPGHALINQLSRQAAEAELGGKLGHALANRLRISRGGARRYRRRVLGGRVARRCDELLEQIAAEHGWQIVAKEVMPDHVHLFVRVGPTEAPAAAVRAFKACTARVLRQGFPYLRRLAPVVWSPSYFAASIGYVWESTVRDYLEHQWAAVAS